VPDLYTSAAASIEFIDASGKAVNPAAAGVTDKSWATRGLSAAMPSIMGMAKGGRSMGGSSVAPSGKGVSANTNGLMEPFEQVTKMANDNPLGSINQWSNLF
jgi:hypothetical protein